MYTFIKTKTKSTHIHKTVYKNNQLLTHKSMTRGSWRNLSVSSLKLFTISHKINLRD